MKKQITVFFKTITVLVLVLSLSSFKKAGGQELEWNKKADMPYPGVGQSACFYDSKIYVTGGSKDGAVHNGDYGDSYMHIYDIPTGNWISGIPMPTARWMHGSAVVDSVLYCIGGGWNIPLNTNEGYNIATDAWSVKAPMPTPRSSIGVAAVENKIYAIGGFGSGGLYNLNEMYDPETDTWTVKAPMPTARVGFGTTVVDGKIYIIGGCYSGVDPLRKVEVYDPQTNTWEYKKDMPTWRFGLVLAPVGNKIYAMGGTPDNRFPSAGKVEVYDVETDTWEKLADQPDSTQWAAGGSWNNKVYILGGEDMCLMTYPQKATIHNFLYESSDVMTGIKGESQAKKPSFIISACPNPFYDNTTLRFEIPENGYVNIEVINAFGRKIQTMTNDLKPQGVNSINLDGLNLPPGIYFCRLSANNKTATIKIVKM